MFWFKISNPFFAITICFECHPFRITLREKIRKSHFIRVYMYYSASNWSWAFSLITVSYNSTTGELLQIWHCNFYLKASCKIVFWSILEYTMALGCILPVMTKKVFSSSIYLLTTVVGDYCECSWKRTDITCLVFGLTLWVKLSLFVTIRALFFVLCAHSALGCLG